MFRHTYIIVCALLMFIFQSGKATHIVGGEVYYDDLGGGNYKIHMKVYRDCINGIPQLDNPAFMTIYDANNVVIQTLQIPLLSQTQIPPSINNPCIQTPNNVCVQEGIYETTVNLPPKTGGYYLAYQRCCRNSTILNLINPGLVGATYWEHIPGPEVVGTNSSPRFKKFPPIFICNGIPIAFDHSATDPDGDQLVYSLCPPFNGLDGCCPLVTGTPLGVSTGTQCPNPPPSCPIVNTPPPYINVPFAAPYNGAYPLASSPAININSSTGFLDGVPTINGQWVVGVCVQEFRAGQLVGTHYRDFQFNVVPCQVTVLSAIQSQTQFCFGPTVQFNNQSIGGNNYFWNFGDNTTLADTSNTVNPIYTYPDTGKYQVTLIVNPNTPCSDTSKKIFEVYPSVNADFTAPIGQCLTGNSFSFTAGGLFIGNGVTNFNWTFGSSASPVSSSQQNPTNVSFNGSGTYPIKLVVKENGCSDSVIKSVIVYNMPIATFDPTPLEGCDPFTVTLTNGSTADTPLSYYWQFSDGTTSTNQMPTHTFSPHGVYGVTLTISTSNGCVANSTFSDPNMITVRQAPTSKFIATPYEASIFEATIDFTDQSIDAVSWLYDFGDGNSVIATNPSHTYNDWGTYYVTQTVKNNLGCPDTSIVKIKILPEFRFWVPNSFTPGVEDGVNDVFKPVIIGAEEYDFYIFNRWGELIFKTNDIDAGWNGMYKGNLCEMSVYVWKCIFKNVVTQKQERHIGHVTLIR